MKSKGSLRCLQGIATGPYPEPDASCPHLPIQLPKIYSDIIFSPAPRSFKWSLPFRSSNQNIVYISHLCHACYMLRPSSPHLFYHPNNIW